MGQIFVAVALLMIGFDFVFVDVFSLRVYSGYKTEIDYFLYHFGYSVVFAMPVIIGMVVRLCFVSWLWWQTVVAVIVFLSVHYSYFSIAALITGEDSHIVRFFYSEINTLWPADYLIMALVMDLLMILGNQIASPLRRKRVSPRVL